ncbi:Transposase family Tnp2 protein [Ceratobasidium sp. AG-Ba]|nr:Transposase family Tnp2 protein [Ceratobasidium sp. AG-Ba]
MFSPAAQSARQSILKSVLELPPGLDCNDLNNGNFVTMEPDITALDPEQLAGADCTAFYDLEELEELYQSYRSTNIKISALSFLADITVDAGFVPDSVSVMTLLVPAHHATQQFSHKIQGLKSISLQLNGIECGHPSLVAQRDSLKYAVDLDVESLVQGAWDYYRSERDHGLLTVQCGLRVADVESNHLVRPFSSPLALSVIILTAVIHTIMGVGRESCNYILSALRCALAMAASIQTVQSTRCISEHLKDIPTTLPTALHYLNLSPRFHTYTVCPKCSALYDEQSGLAIPQACTKQDLDGFTCNEGLYSTHYRGGKVRSRPTARYSHFPLENWLSELLLRPGIEDMIESTVPSSSSVLWDVWNAPYLCTFHDREHNNFFDAPPGELRLAMLVFHDYFNPYTMKLTGRTCSVGCVFMVCLNLPSDIRYDPSYAYLASIIPGPDEASMADLHNFMRPIVDNLEELYDPGIWIPRTHKFPRGRKVRVVAPISCLDTPAARAFGGFTPHNHMCFCNMCMAQLLQMRRNTLEGIQLRDISSHREQVAKWQEAPSLSQQRHIYDLYGIRHSEWLRFSWWDPFVGMPVGPMHWSRNICEKQLRECMDWNWKNLTGVPSAPSLPFGPVSDLEYEWGKKALHCLNTQDFMASKLTSGLTHYLCRQLGIYEAGVSVEGMLLVLDEWRKDTEIIGADGELIDKAEGRAKKESVALARSHFYLSKAGTASYVDSHINAPELLALCQKFGLETGGKKKELAERLFTYHSRIKVNYLPETYPTKKASVSVLGGDILIEVQNDMGRTTLPRWLKHPPKHFANASSKSLKAEEWKSLATVSFVFTLVRVWGNLPSTNELRQRLDHFLHLVLCVRILAFQSLVESDIDAFEHHYHTYLDGLTKLYPYEKRTSVQHAGLHIPTFLRALGPSTRYSESTCEMFIGLLQDISTNFKFGTSS